MDSNMGSGFLSHLITNKLTHDNYLIWKRQIVSFIRGRDLHGHLDGRSLAPPAMLLQETVENDGKIITYEVPNSEYDKWVEKDQILVAYIPVTLSERVLQTIPDDTTTFDLWVFLANSYAQVSEARILQLKWQFQSLRKGTKSVNDFFSDMRVITDQLAAVRSPVLDKEIVQQVLGSLGINYHVFCTTMHMLPTLPSFEDLRAKLIQYEVDLAHESQHDDTHPVMMTCCSETFECPQTTHDPARAWHSPDSSSQRSPCAYLLSMQ
ncbi:unnamed protein product [Victoria cruziana]